MDLPAGPYRSYLSFSTIRSYSPEPHFLISTEKTLKKERKDNTCLGFLLCPVVLSRAKRGKPVGFKEMGEKVCL